MRFESEESGQMVLDVWLELPKHYPHVVLDAFVVMPNHVHGIIGLTEQQVGAGLRPAPTMGRRHGLPEIVRAFKSFSARRVNAYLETSGPLWQRGYYEHVIRDEASLSRIREYILNNPLRWAYDRDNPLGKPDGDEQIFWEAVGQNLSKNL